jgi:hypothetical protein
VYNDILQMELTKEKDMLNWIKELKAPSGMVAKSAYWGLESFLLHLGQKRFEMRFCAWANKASFEGGAPSISHKELPHRGRYVFKDGVDVKVVSDRIIPAMESGCLSEVLKELIEEQVLPGKLSWE